MRKELKMFNANEICDVLNEIGLDSDVVLNIGFQFELISSNYEILRKGNELLVDGGVELTLKIMQGRWGYNWFKPKDFKVIKRDDEEGNTYVRIEWL